MNNAFVRIESVEIVNFKNVRHGFLDFKGTRKPYKASVLGLYGQNGSGKTALIDTLSLLKTALSGQKIPSRFADYVNVDADFARLKFGFKVMMKDSETEYHAIYEFKIKKEKGGAGQNISRGAFSNEETKATVYDEILSYSCNCAGRKIKMGPLVNACSNEVFGPESKYKILVGGGKKHKADLTAAKLLSLATSRSFVFSPELLNVIRENCKDLSRLNFYEALVWFGNYELFVINTRNSGLISMDALPLAFQYENKGRTSVGSLMIGLNTASLIPRDTLELVKDVIKDMNIVLTQLVPGLTIGVRELGSELFKNGSVGVKIRLVSNRNNKEIPLQYESEGIKKIISVLQLLIVVYNKESITVAVDELDSGVFEYLLGEILRIISEKGKGQLIFTSHNLRPLETLDKGFVAFTTANADNRYIRLKDIKTNNNLRDFYYRDIVLGEQKEFVYEPTDNYEIALALREAGQYGGS